MKISQALIATTAATTVLAAPAAVTVTEHVHQEATVTVQGYLYVSGGQTYTSVTTLGVEPETTAAVAAAPTGLLRDDTNGLFGTGAATTADTAEPTTTSTSTIIATSTQAAAAATTSAAASSDSNLSDFAQSMLDEHNAKRALHVNTGSLTYSDTLAAYAQNYADQYDCSGNLVHSGGPYGENLALGYGTTGAVDGWYDEISSYDWSNPGFSEATGHFTQVVWAGSAQVGCGIKQCGNEWGEYVICSYQDAGNMIGQFAENVLALA